MGIHHSVPDAFRLSGDNVSRITQLLRLAQRHARLDQAIVGPRLQDALTDLEDALTDQIGADNAVQDDLADAEESGAADRQRRASYPRYQAA
jgi:hypothetical protein